MGKAVNTVEKASSVANRIRLGCILIVANLFFLGFCLWGVYAGYISWKLQKEGKTTIGKVVQLNETDNSDGGCCVYSPVVEFQVEGHTYSFESNNSSDPPAYKVGEEVAVIYNPDNPNTAQINKWLERWILPFILIPTMVITALLLNFFLIRSFLRNNTTFL